MTVAGDELLVTSKYGKWFGITTVISDKDREALQMMLQRR